MDCSVTKNMTRTQTKKNETERTLVVMDTENLIYSCKEINGEGPDLKRMDEYLHGSYDIADKICFVPITRLNGYRGTLTYLGWTFRDVVSFHEENGERRTIKNALDLELALETYDQVQKSNINRVVLISGDGDFLPLVKRIKKMGILVDIISIEACASSKLMKFADSFSSYRDTLKELVEDDITPPIISGQFFVKDAFQRASEIIEKHVEEKGSPIFSSQLNIKLREISESFHYKDLGFKMFKSFLIKGERDGYFSLSHKKGAGTWAYPYNGKLYLEEVEKTVVG